MMDWDLNKVANIIILISAVIIAAKNIYAFFKKPVDKVADKARANEEKHIEEVIGKKIPTMFNEHCDVLMKSLDEIKEINVKQGQQLKDLQASVDKITDAEMDILRYNMNRIYYKYHPYKKILSADKKAFLKLYNDYKAMEGNTWIDELYKDLENWPIVSNEEDLYKN